MNQIRWGGGLDNCKMNKQTNINPLQITMDLNEWGIIFYVSLLSLPELLRSILGWITYCEEFAE